MKVTVNMAKAKEIAHTIRRDMRAKEFEPWDSIIMKQIPGQDATLAEAERQKIRDKYADMQAKIDAADTAQELKQILGLQ